MTTRIRRTIRKGKFYAFDNAIDSSDNDFNFDMWVDQLDLNKTQKHLLSHLLRRIELVIWFGDRDEHDKECARLEICTLLDVGSWGIGDEAEIQVLKALKSKIEAAIAVRINEPTVK